MLLTRSIVEGQTEEEGTRTRDEHTRARALHQRYYSPKARARRAASKKTVPSAGSSTRVQVEAGLVGEGVRLVGAGVPGQKVTLDKVRQGRERSRRGSSNDCTGRGQSERDGGDELHGEVCKAKSKEEEEDGGADKQRGDRGERARLLVLGETKAQKSVGGWISNLGELKTRSGSEGR